MVRGGLIYSKPLKVLIKTKASVGGLMVPLKKQDKQVLHNFYPLLTGENKRSSLQNRLPLPPQF